MPCPLHAAGIHKTGGRSLLWTVYPLGPSHMFSFTFILKPNLLQQSVTLKQPPGISLETLAGPGNTVYRAGCCRENTIGGLYERI